MRVVPLMAIWLQQLDEQQRELFAFSANVYTIERKSDLGRGLLDVAANYTMEVKNRGPGHRLGPLAVHLLVHLVDYVLATPLDIVTERIDLLEFSENSVPSGPLSLEKYVGCLRTQKMFDATKLKVTTLIRHDVGHEIHEGLLACGAKLLSGKAPRGYLAREVQATLDAARAR
jgi:hypothetical protein